MGGYVCRRVCVCMCGCVGKLVHGCVSWYVSGMSVGGCSGMYVGMLVSECMSMHFPPLAYNTLKIPRYYLGCRTCILPTFGVVLFNDRYL